MQPTTTAPLALNYQQMLDHVARTYPNSCVVAGITPTLHLPGVTFTVFEVERDAMAFMRQLRGEKKSFYYFRHGLPATPVAALVPTDHPIAKLLEYIESEMPPQFSGSHTADARRQILDGISQLAMMTLDTGPNYQSPNPTRLGGIDWPHLLWLINNAAATLHDPLPIF